MSCYVHDLPGRLRVRIPRLKGDAITANHLVNQVNQIAGISSVIANPVTGSILIQYDASIVNSATCLAVLNIQTPREPVESESSRAHRLSSKVAEAALWYLLEKTLERCFLLILASVL